MGGTKLTTQGFDKAQVASVANAIAVLSKYVPGTDKAHKIAVAKKIARDIIVNNKSGTLRKSSSFLNHYMELEAISALRSLKHAEALKQADSWAETTRPDNPSYTNTGDKVTDTAKDAPVKISDTETRQQYIQRLVNSNYSLAAANAAADIRYPPGPSAVGATTTVVRNHGMGGGKSTITTKIPPTGVIKQASVAETYPWAVAIGAAEPEEKITLDSGIRSASQIPSYYYDVDGNYAISRRSNAIAAIREQQNQKKLKQASEEIPSHLYAYASEYLP